MSSDTWLIERKIAELESQVRGFGDTHYIRHQIESKIAKLREAIQQRKALPIFQQQLHSERDRRIATQAERRAFEAERISLAQQWEEHKKIASNSRERAHSFDQRRWNEGWQEGCGHKQGRCDVDTRWIQYDPNNPEHKKLQRSPPPKHGGAVGIYYGDKVLSITSRDPKKPYHLPRTKHPNPRVQAIKDREKEISRLMEAGKVEEAASHRREAEMIKIQNEKTTATMMRGLEKRRAKKAYAKGRHPAASTTKSPSRRRSAGTTSRYRPPPRRRR